MAAITPLNFQERVKIEAYLKQEISCSQIARNIGRSKNGIISEVRKNGGPKLYCAVSAQKDADRRLIEKKQKLHTLNVGNKRTFHMKQRIENLEMQVEILYETIKEIIKNGK